MGLKLLMSDWHLLWEIGKITPVVTGAYKNIYMYMYSILYAPL